MCVEKVHRVMMAIFVTIILISVNVGAMLLANILMIFMIIMLLSWAFFNFCPAVTILSKFLPSCECGKK